MPDRVPMHQLELHVAHACQLACDGCQHYANYPLGGVVPFAVGGAWLQAWAARVAPRRFKLLGGEPLLNLETHRYVRLAADLWPTARRILTTNGLLIERQGADLVAALRETETEVMVTRHATDPAYTAALDRNLAALASWGVRFSVDAAAVSGWIRGYRGAGDAILPFADGDPRASWQNCISRRCMQLHENRLWKCPPLAYWGLLAAKFPGLDRGAWAPFFAYEGIGLEADAATLAAFVARQDEADLCGRCPANPVPYQKDIGPLPPMRAGRAAEAVE